MPTFDYKCKACGHIDDCFVTNPDKTPKIVICPKCGLKTFIRQISAGGGFIFKGTGFYCTDYCKPEPPKKEDNGSTEEVSE